MTFAKRLIQSTLGKFGYRLARLNDSKNPVYGLDCLFPLLKRFGFDPKHVLDVGANRGNWTRTALKYFPHAAYTLVEPQGELKVYIQDLVDRGVGKALGQAADCDVRRRAVRRIRNLARQFDPAS